MTLASPVDLGDTHDPPVPSGEGLADRRRRAQHVDDDPERSSDLLDRGEPDPDPH